MRGNVGTCVSRSSHSLPEDLALDQRPKVSSEPIYGVPKEKWDSEEAGRGTRVCGSYQQVDYQPMTGTPDSSPSTGAACSVPVFWQPGRATWVASAAASRRGQGFLLMVVAANSPPPAGSYRDVGRGADSCAPVPLG